eukprot:bmy_16530T0
MFEGEFAPESTSWGGPGTAGIDLTLKQAKDIQGPEEELHSFSLTATCYFGIRKHLLKTNSYGKNRITRDQVLKMAAAVVLAFIICWLPFHVLTFLDALAWMGVINSCEVIAVIDLALPFAILLGFTNSCINPFLYCFVGNRFQQKLRRVFRGSESGKLFAGLTYQQKKDPNLTS